MRGGEARRGRRCEQCCWFKLIPLCLDLVGAPIKRIIIVATVITFCEKQTAGDRVRSIANFCSPPPCRFTALFFPGVFRAVIASAELVSPDECN